MPKLNTRNCSLGYTFLNIYEKITSFCQVLNEMHIKENWLFFLRHGVFSSTENDVHLKSVHSCCQTVRLTFAEIE